MFLTDKIIEDKQIGTGDEVFITGLFAHAVGSDKNSPIVRMGNIAMMPSEPIRTSEGLMDAYLIEARSIGGLSGSPAFVRATTSLGPVPHYLLGLMHGHWDLPPGAKNDGGDVFDHLGAVNMGIAIVVPAKRVLETLKHPGLVSIRALDETAERKRRSDAEAAAAHST
jgi:hypothetical protein